MCLEDSDLKKVTIKHSHTEFKDLLSVYFSSCDIVNNAGCRRDDEVKKWMADKDLLVLVNQEAFNYRVAADAAEKFSPVAPEKLVIKESIVKRVPLTFE